MHFARLLWMLACALPALGDESWQAELAKMPLATNRIHFFKSEPAEVILRAFKSNAVIRVVVFMPAATDELFFNDRGSVVFTNSNSTLLDAVSELTTHTEIRATFHEPFLLLRATNDFTTAFLKPDRSLIFEKFRKKPFTPKWVMIDKEWEQLYSTLKKSLGIKITPNLHAPDSWHFYRVSFAAHGLNGFEAIELVSLATQTQVEVEKHRMIFSRRMHGSSDQNAIRP